MTNAKFICLLIFVLYCSCSNISKRIVSNEDMQAIYHEISTPHKFGLVLVPADNSKKLDCPFVFRKDSTWYMTYIVFDGRGYETWITTSRDLLTWGGSRMVLGFPQETASWDANQRAGYPSLYDPEWGGSYRLRQYNGRFWMSYLGGKMSGYEEGRLAIGISSTSDTNDICREWQCQPGAVLSSDDADVRWWEDLKLYKSTVIRDVKRLTGHDFIMYYNAYGDSLHAEHKAERIGMAVSDDMKHWSRFQRDPVINHFRGISGDPQITKIGELWVMFYFGAFWRIDQSDGAFDRFACSYDLIHWTDWTGENLVFPSETYDSRYAHKPCIVKWNGTVYHFYCAVNGADQRGIALATSRDLGQSKISFFSVNMH